MKKISFIALVYLLLFSIDLSARSSSISDEISDFIHKNNLTVVDTNYVKKIVGDGTVNAKKSILIDARTENRYNFSTIPTSINIPSPSFNKYVHQLDKVAKDKEIVIFCDGTKCPKSVKVAKKLLDAGFKNLKIYQDGMPLWRSSSYFQVNDLQMKKVMTSPDLFTIIDIRSEKKFAKSHISDSISVPNKEVDTLEGKIPFDRSTPILIISDNAKKDPKPFAYAQKLIDSNYRNVGVYVKGYNAWLALEKKEKRRKAEDAKKRNISPFVGPIKKGVDRGTVDTKWFIKHYKRMPSKTTIVDVREDSERKSGFIMGSKNISLEENTPEEFINKLPKNRYIIFYCARGNRAYDSYNLVKSKNIPLSDKILYLDAVVKCKRTDCAITPNEPTNPVVW